ncbi:guanylate kinase [Entomobacter blattae]|uniref:Guanylate kinase n=1 Tax=Entomobacter blattae TaxID=2762277 RepID=A0A7H1NPU9_9PROT|nr:guanylate kinase [Entomobacter blattae]QNT77809.1 Guanylate kinase [Entomobacter blattae]
MTPSIAPPISRRGVCFVISAPSGAGKSTIANALRAAQPNLSHSISVTTRKPRPGEVDGVHYHFVSEKVFKELIETQALLEWAMVFRHGYGTPGAPVEKALAEGKDLIFDIDWQGHRQIRSHLPEDVVSLFVLPPSLQELERRLNLRASDHPDEIHHRMKAAREEISHWQEFDYTIINTDLDQAIQEATAILSAARIETARRKTGLQAFIGDRFEVK